MAQIIKDNDLLSYIETDWCRTKPFLSENDMAYFLQFHLWQKPRDTACVVFLNRKRRFLRCLQLTEGALHQVNLLSGSLHPYLENAAYLFVGHTHADNTVEPSPEDIHTTRILTERFPAAPRFLCHIIVNHHLNYQIVELQASAVLP